MEVENIMKKLAIYIHIPFCKQKCKYCDFTSFAHQEQKVNLYVETLLKEIKHYSIKANNYIVTSVYFGGGTPSFIDENYIKMIWEILKENYSLSKDLEATIEVNPGTVNLDKLRSYRDLGLNRISFGVQVAQDRLLKEIGRVHSIDDAIESFYMAREAGFCNISLDLMFGLPNQTLADVKETLDKFIELDPEHISTYSLKVEENTTFGQMKKEGKLMLPSDEEEREMYYLIKRKLKQSGYNHYEISNFAKDNFESRHNTAYWERQDYLGFGLSASSCFDEVRYSNTTNLVEYINNFYENIEEKEVLSQDDIESEKVILGLRMLKGIDKDLIRRKEWREAMKRLISLELLYEDENKIYLTDKGLDLANQVFVEFI